MSRVVRFTVYAVLWVFALLSHFMAVVLFGPDSALRTQTAGGSIGGTTASSVHTEIYQILGIWVPLAIIGFGTAWLAFQEFRRQRVGRALR